MSRSLRLLSLLEELRIHVEEHADAESLEALEAHVRCVHDRAIGRGEPLSACTTHVVMITPETRESIALFTDVVVAATEDRDLSRETRDRKWTQAYEALTRFLRSNRHLFTFAQRLAWAERADYARSFAQGPSA